MYMSTSGAVFTISTTVNAASISKGGSGTMAITGIVNLTDTNPIVSVNAGTLNLTGATINTGAPTTSKVVYQVAGGTLAGVPSINGTLRGNGTVTGPVILAGAACSVRRRSPATPRPVRLRAH